MKAVRIHRFGPPEVVVIEDVPVPSPGPREVLVRVAAAGVAPWDALIREGKSKVSPQPPLTLGSDLSGVVAAVGSEVTGFATGDEVYGVTNPQFCGAQAEYAVAAAGMIGPKPHSLSHVEAASAIARAHEEEMLRALGAESIIDPTSPDFEKKLPQVDAILDTVGGGTLERCVAALKPGGRLVTTVSTQPLPSQAIFFYAEVTTVRLRTLTTLFESGRISPRVGSVLPLSEARRAQEMLAGAAHLPGKIVLQVT
jgi:NADPH:quinone reductase-like Zn-dependent oxidoreductase